MVTGWSRVLSEDVDGYYVYLNSGEVQKVSPADSIAVSAGELAIRLRGKTVATFPRSLVFSCSRALPSAPVLG